MSVDSQKVTLTLIIAISFPRQKIIGGNKKFNKLIANIYKNDGERMPFLEFFIFLENIKDQRVKKKGKENVQGNLKLDKTKLTDEKL